jgi:uncharacterized protein (DUF924 family)
VQAELDLNVAPACGSPAWRLTESKMAATPADVTGFWRSAGPEKWFAPAPTFDDALRLRFEATHHAAARGDYAAWEASAEGALALLILLDQVPRNLFRDSAHAFATDPLARRIAVQALEAGFERRLEPILRPFLYLPFEHSEALADQDRAVALFEAHDAETGEVEYLKWAVMHRDVIRRFGRFPYRNAALGRETTPEEQVFLDEGGFAG